MYIIGTDTYSLDSSAPRACICVMKQIDTSIVEIINVKSIEVFESECRRVINQYTPNHFLLDKTGYKRGYKFISGSSL